MECEGVLVRTDWGSLDCEAGVRRENWAQCGWEVTLGEKAEISLEWEVFVKDEGHVEAALTVGAHGSVERRRRNGLVSGLREKIGAAQMEEWL